MRKVILNLAVSLDGFIEDANGAYDWCFTDKDYGMSAFFTRIDAIFLGRKSYELVKKTGDGYLGDMTRYVISTTMQHPGDRHTILIRDDVATAVRKIKNEPGRDIWLFGGARLISTFLNEGLVDELALAVHPILLGNGKKLFEDIQERISLTLYDVLSYDSGLIQLFYVCGEKRNE